MSDFPVKLVSPEGREVLAHDARTLNDLVMAHSYKRVEKPAPRAFTPAADAK